MITSYAPSKNGTKDGNSTPSNRWDWIREAAATGGVVEEVEARPRRAASSRTPTDAREATSSVQTSATERRLPLDAEDNGGSHPALSAKVRDKRGRFAKGNKFGCGNPFYRRLAAIRRAFATAVTHQETRLLARELYSAAKQGDRAAAALWMAYAIGRPEKVVDPDAVDVDEWHRFQQLPTSNADFERIWHRIPIHNMLELLKTLWPERVKVFYQGLAGIVKGERPRAPDLSEAHP